MKTICAWCKKVLKSGAEKEISHGICKQCEEKWFIEFEKRKGKK